MSPEQATGAADVDQQSDVFALGSILYEMLTAKVAFDAPTVAMILLRILNQQPAPASSHNPAVTQAMEAVIKRALEKDKHGRYPTARALAESFAAALGLSGKCEEWANRSESDIANALSAVKAKPKPAATQLGAAPAQAPRTTSTTRSVSDVPIEVPRQSAATKWIVITALGLVVIGVLVLVMR
jgi:serine/threonine-protein kinase